MIQVLAHSFGRLFGRGEEAHYVPIFDNALKANELLQGAEALAAFDQPNDLATDGTSLFIADGSLVRRIEENGPSIQVLDAGKPITAIACLDGGIACALSGREIRIFGGRFDGFSTGGLDGATFHSVNALYAEGSQLFATDGSQEHGYDDWRRDLMKLGRTGRLFRIDPLEDRVVQLKQGLEHSFGVARLNGSTLVSESWRHRVVEAGDGKANRLVQPDLPAYPSRMAAAADGLWLTMFCARTELVEFVLREDAYRRQMIETMDPDLWISPQLGSISSPHAPLQWGAMRQLGVVKPWSPPRSYGLVVKLDRHGAPKYSLHSRMGGRFHGIVAAAELNGRLYLLSRGDNVLLRIDIAKAEEELAR